MSAILKAQVAFVKIGYREIEGLMFEDGRFGFGVPQMASFFPYFHDDQSQAAKKLKRLMGKDFKTTKTKALNQRNHILAIEALDFPKVVKELFKKDDAIASELLDELVGVSIVQLCADAFKVKFEKEERQTWLKNRQEGKLVRKSFDDVVKDYCDTHDVSDNYRNFIFINYSNCINKVLFGKTSKQLCQERNCDRHTLRDTHPAPDLKMIEYVENYAKICVLKSNMEPLEAVKAALDFHQEPLF